jgi:hypothetical protein
MIDDVAELYTGFTGEKVSYEVYKTHRLVCRSSKMSVCQTEKHGEVVNSYNMNQCRLCLEDMADKYHECKSCQAQLCMHCINQWGYTCFEYGRQPSCGYCRQGYELSDLWALWIHTKTKLSEPNIGEKRKATDDLLCDEEWSTTEIWFDDLPPLTWRAYFQIIGLDKPVLNIQPYSGFVEWHNLPGSDLDWSVHEGLVDAEHICEWPDYEPNPVNSLLTSFPSLDSL